MPGCVLGWNADETVRKRLAVSYAVNVVEKGVACCDHTCNNPLLHQMVVNILSLFWVGLFDMGAFVGGRKREP